MPGEEIVCPLVRDDFGQPVQRTGLRHHSGISAHTPDGHNQRRNIHAGCNLVFELYLISQRKFSFEREIC